MRSNRRGQWLAGLLALVILVGALWWPIDYIAVKPGLVKDLKEVITVEGGEKADTGRFYLTAVLTQQANLSIYLRSLLDHSIRLTPKREMIPEGWDQKQYNDAMLRLMEESKVVAEVVALRRLGYEIEIQGGGAQVVHVLPYSPVKDILLPDDVILSFNRQTIRLAEDLTAAVGKLKPGSPVTLSVKRGEETKEISAKLTENPDDKGKAMLGVQITTHNWQPKLPVKINANTADIGGSSAGTMMVLEIMNQVDKRDLAKGHRIAGTGTISLSGVVGKIGGVQQKVITAERQGMEYFIVPEEDYPDAAQVAKKIKLVKVRTLDDVMAFLNGL
ncbi:MAG: PDZ domain-containing protein [Bacillota bacterium]